MANVSVSPQEFHFVTFDAGVISRIVDEVATDVGLPPEAPVAVTIDEATPLGRVRLSSVDPIAIDIEGGAFEDPTNPRSLSERLVKDVVGRLLLRAKDRSSDAFAAAPSEDDLTLPQLTAWDAYCMGRLDRLGYDVRKPRRLYHFRNRHGFNDVADAEFERLWTGEGLGWADLAAACERTEAVSASTAAALS